MSMLEKKIKWGVRGKLLMAMVGISIALLFIFTYLSISTQRAILETELDRRIEILKKNLTDRGKTLSDHLARLAENDIATYNLSNIAVVVRKAISENEELHYAILMDSSRSAFIHTYKPLLEQKTLNAAEDLFAQRQREPTINEFTKEGAHFIEFVVPLNVSTQIWGWLRLGFSQDLLNREIIESKQEISKQVGDMIYRALLTSGIFIVICAIIVLVIANRLSRPIVALTQSAEELAKGNFGAAENVIVRSQDEVGVLSRAFRDMSKKLSESHGLLEEYNRTLEHKVDERTKELQKAYIDLQRSQEQLVLSEKMVSLGQLVAGVAHEINTPIGIGVTISTHFMELTENINKSFEKSTMTKSELKEYFEGASQASEMIYRNLQRTAELVRSFKMVSSDQTSHEKRKFNIKSYLNDILASLQPKLKKEPHQVIVEGEGDIEIDSYPGAFAQVITNFVMNTLENAYEKGVEGSIRINVYRKGEKNIVVKYSDDGKGIPEENLKKIFDPFFTTRRGEGGTGLGLHIVYNLVTHTFKGKINCTSKPGEGTTFVIEIPCEV